MSQAPSFQCPQKRKVCGCFPEAERNSSSGSRSPAVFLNETHQYATPYYITDGTHPSVLHPEDVCVNPSQPPAGFSFSPPSSSNSLTHQWEGLGDIAPGSSFFKASFNDRRTEDQDGLINSRTISHITPGGMTWPNSVPSSVCQTPRTPDPSSRVPTSVLLCGSGESQCDACHIYCFRCAQIIFFKGILVGVTILVVGGFYHQELYGDLQVLIYIGALITLVCVVLLVIFCSVYNGPRMKRLVGQHAYLTDPEAVPLRPVDLVSPATDPSCVLLRPAELSLRKDSHSGRFSSTLPGPHSLYSPQCHVMSPLNYPQQGESPFLMGPHGATSLAGKHSSMVVNHSVSTLGRSCHQKNDPETESQYQRIWRQPIRPSPTNCAGCLHQHHYPPPPPFLSKNYETSSKL